MRTNNRATLELIKIRDGSHCRYCGRTRHLTLEHLVPLCRGGRSRHHNLGVSCRRCNIAKGCLTDVEYKAIRHDPEHVHAKRAEMMVLLTAREMIERQVRSFKV